MADVEQSPSKPDADVTVGAKAALAVIRLYQAARHGRPSPCRFVPSCSHYGYEAILLHGFFRGGWLTVRRIGRCRPGGGHGVDLVPLPKQDVAHV